MFLCRFDSGKILENNALTTFNLVQVRIERIFISWIVPLISTSSLDMASVEVARNFVELL